jgi:hypothetical protein
VAPLPPDRRTHVAPTKTGQLFWVQESPDPGGHETVFSLTDGGLAGATAFSNASVLDALGERGGRGSIQSLAIAPDGDLYFFFAGDNRRKLLAALGVFSPPTGRTRVLADASVLRDASGLGNTLALARGTILRGNGTRSALWLRHDHGFALLTFEPGGDPTKIATRRAFDRVRAPDGESVELVSPAEDLAAVGDAWVYLDRRRGRVWRIGAGGDATALADVSDLPKAVTAPAADERGRLVMFAPDGPPFVEPRVDPLAPPPKVTNFPAWVFLDGERRAVLGREKFQIADRPDARGLAFPQLFRDRSSWVGYDAPTGELLRLKVVER